jgi:hypothetical protein
MGNDFMFVFELDPECRVGQQFGDHAREFKDFFFSHLRVFFLFSNKVAREASGPGGNLAGNYTIMSPL